MFQPPNLNGEPDDLQLLNQEIEDAYAEIEELHDQTAALMGLMAGGYAYFLQQLMLAHQSQAGLTPDACEKIVVDALRRIQSSEKRFGLEFLAEIQIVLQKMSKPISLEPYLTQLIDLSDK